MPAPAGWWGARSRLVWTTDEVLTLVSRSEREFAPGTAFGYSNTNYLVLGRIIENVTGNPWAEEVKGQDSRSASYGRQLYRGIRTGAATGRPGLLRYEQRRVHGGAGPSLAGPRDRGRGCRALVSTVP